ncbi:MAG: YegS/Rv2252/BmrU family lipid kinase [Bacteroidia bacterium]|jgi:YegS/Rv2252/BmrU family lipid kinase|nr:YegS/Rv2252/BmrU family lipid kinase [Bacteroidia bacterium]
MSGKRIAFIVNPNSGSNRGTNRVELINKLMPSSAECTVIEWKEINDRDRIFAQVLEGNYDIAVACGGDGTVNQLAHVLCGTNTALGILPFGSGNGLARHLGIPMNVAAAMRIIEAGHSMIMDKGTINNLSFFCTAGTGFDARIGQLFAESKTRGFWTYAKITLRELRRFSPEIYTIEVDGITYRHRAFLVTVANAGQYGNNAWIAPLALVNDGILHVSVLGSFSWYDVPALIWRMFGQSIDRSNLVNTYSGRSIKITRAEAGPAHFDGEPAMLDKELQIDITPSALNVIVPKDFKG